VAIFLIFLVFPDHLPCLGLGFITVGDLFGKVVGMRFGRIRLLRGRTLEGSLAFTAGGLAAGWLLRLSLRGVVPPVPLHAVLAGPVVAALVELFSGGLDDNFTVGLVSTAFLYSLRYFLGA
jgi:dolichol kinase